MWIQIFKAKIGYARVTEANLLYEGSITVDRNLLDAVDIIPGEKVQILNVNNGQRFETYTIAGPSGSGVVCLNGPAARLGVVDDPLMIISYALMTPEEAKTFQPKVIHCDAHNAIKD
jgi:aspartate 1-decarboxylase